MCVKSRKPCEWPEIGSFHEAVGPGNEGGSIMFVRLNSDELHLRQPLGFKGKLTTIMNHCTEEWVTLTISLRNHL